MEKEEENKILSVQEILHLQSDKHPKKNQIMPEVDTNRYVLNQKTKNEPVRNFAPVINITEEQRRQFSQGDTGVRNRNSVLAEQARYALKIVEKHAEEEAVEQAKMSEENSTSADNASKKLASDIKNGSFDFSFGALIEGNENLKEKI